MMASSARAAVLGIAAVMAAVGVAQQPQGPASGGIAWYATLESGLREAKRTGKPILLVAAAPHCAGVSGIW
jgi:hypothetical protein